MFELKLSVETDWPINTPDIGRRVLEVLTRDSRWMPERFGGFEPLRGRFSAESPESFLDGWAGVSADSRTRVAFLFARRKSYRYEAAVLGYPRGSRLNLIYFSFPEKKPNDLLVNDCLKLAVRLFEVVHGQYGHLCLREEYTTKNVTGAWTGPTGASEGGTAHGTDRTRHLPGIYWANFFGPAYIAFFGEGHLESAPAQKGPGSSTCRTLLTAPSPYTWNLPETRQREALLRAHLGADAFFDPSQPARPTRAPVFALSQRDPLAP